MGLVKYGKYKWINVGNANANISKYRDYDCSEEIDSSEYCSEKCKYESKMAGH